MNNFDINKILSTISKMDKTELEKNIQKAQKILNNPDIQNSLNNKHEDN